MAHDVAVRPLRVLSVCSGAGQLDRGFAGAVESSVVCYVERELTAAAVLVARMEDGALDRAPVWDDVTTFDAGEWRGAVDCVLSGFPCQPHSVAGKRLGAEDERDLWPEVKRIVGECQPAWVALENVSGAVSYFYHHVLPGLQELGYETEALLCEAADVGAPHRRERLFVLGRNVAYGRRELEYVQQRQAGREPTGSGEQLAHAENDGRTGSGAARRGRGRPENDGAVVADTTHGGLRRGATPGGRRQPALASKGLADASDGLEGRERGVMARTREGRLDPDAGSPSIFPPPPDDTEGWERVLRERPDLAPAVANTERPRLLRAEQCQDGSGSTRRAGTNDIDATSARANRRQASTQSQVRQLADGLEPGLALTRAAQLRLAGNGVVPQQAAFAFGLLMQRFNVG